MRKRRLTRKGNRGGFSLVEVSLAVLLIGVGVLSLFSLFPAGLNESKNAVRDTHIGLFAEKVLAALRANGYEINNWTKWQNMTLFRQAILDEALIEGTQLVQTGESNTATIEFAGMDITYKLDIQPVSDTDDFLRSASLRVCIGSEWDADAEGWFYTEFFYAGAAP
jgi:uncharacterized protein (TIGR02598 family)